MQLNLNKLLTIAPFFLWGTAMVAMKGTLDHTTPLFMAVMRLLPAGLLILAATVIFRLPQPKTLKAWLWIGLFALVDGTMFQGFLAEGLARTGAGLGSVLIDSQPLAVALLCCWLFGEAIGWVGWLGLSLGILGISAIGLPEDWIFSLFQGAETTVSFNIENILQSGELLMLLASLSMAVGTVIIRPLGRHADPVVATGWHMILGSLPLCMGSGIWEEQQWVQITGSDWLALAYSTVFGTAIAYGIFFYLANRENLTSLSALTFLTPVFALLFGYLLLSEQLSLLQWCGVSLSLVAIYLINQRERIACWWESLVAGNFTVFSTKMLFSLEKEN